MTDQFWSPYTPAFFRAQTEGRERFEIDALSRVIWEVLRPKSLVDVGCGRGQFVRQFLGMGVPSRGIEGPMVQDTVGFVVPTDKITIVDLRDTRLSYRELDADVILCLEVMEHLPTDTALQLARQFADSKARFIVFSAAVPGQGGTGHINERPHEYWDWHFAEWGWDSDRILRQSILDGWLYLIGKVEECPWYFNNLRVFVRARKEEP